jgi:uncharacterized phosphosugar-binding protein
MKTIGKISIIAIIALLNGCDDEIVVCNNLGINSININMADVSRTDGHTFIMKNSVELYCSDTGADKAGYNYHLTPDMKGGLR